MANEIGWTFVILEDGWPGTVNPNLTKPDGGWDNTTDCCVTIPTYPPGTKIAGYNDNTRCPGGYVMCYMGRTDGSHALAFCSDLGNLAAPSVGHLICAHYEGTSAEGNEDYVAWYYVTSDCLASDASLEGYSAVAVACGSMSESNSTAHDGTLIGGPEYGWFWVGGVCPGQDGTSQPNSDLTWMWDSSVTTAGQLTKGRGIELAPDGSADGSIMFSDYSVGDATTNKVGWVIKTDG